MSDSGNGKSAVRTGWLVFGLLAVLTVVEYIIAVSLDANLPVIMAIAVAKAALILWYFMHVARLWLGGGGGH
jgi:caa(3)-type oxidase subunit IV